MPFMLPVARKGALTLKALVGITLLPPRPVAQAQGNRIALNSLDPGGW